VPFSEVHMKAISKIPKAEIAGNPSDLYSPAGWFSYFWSEAYLWEADFAREHAGILPLFNQLFQIPAGWEPPKVGGITQKFQADLLTSAPQVKLTSKKSWEAVAAGQPTVLLDAMEALLRIGFRRVPISKNALLATNDTSAEMLKYIKRVDHTRKVQLGWRGDTRSFADLVKSGGFICKAESVAGGYAQGKNMRKPWHPYSKLSIRSDMWYRRVSADNCTMTITSVTRDCKTGSVFPQLSEVHVFPGTEERAEVQKLVDEGKVARTKLSEVKVREASGKETTLLRFADTVQLFLCVLNGQYFDTFAAQEEYSQTVGFKEIAMRDVPSDDILGAVTYVRVHHGTTNQEGFTALYDPVASVEVSDEVKKRKTAAYSGDALYDAAREEEARAKNTFTAAWSEDGATRAGAKLDKAPGISKILEVKRLSDGKVLYTA
jgi:hypothetical protein